MRTRLFFTLFILLSLTATAQDLTRIIVEGQVIVPTGDDPEGVVIYNSTSEKGTITDNEGIFFLSVANNDRVVVQSLAFSPVTIIIDQGIINTKRMTITLRESVEELEEIVVTPYDLTGNIRVDVNRVPQKVAVEGPDVATIRMQNSIYDGQGSPENVALDDERWRYGLNFVNLFKALVGERKEDPENFERTASDKLAALYNDDFFNKTLNIKKKNTGAFINYAAANGLNDEMLEPGNELGLIKFLIEQRDSFKRTQQGRE